MIPHTHQAQLLYAYFMRHSVAWIRTNKRNDQTLQAVAKMLEGLAEEVEKDSLEKIQHGISG